MSQIKGHVGKWELSWKSVPHGASGIAKVEVSHSGQAQTAEVRWRRDPHGIWIETDHGVYGFDLDAQTGDDGRLSYHVLQRTSDREWNGLHFVRPGEEEAGAASSGPKKGFRVRAQMPGKIIRILVNPEDVIEKDQPVAVMEAMKMENEIRAPHGGKISKIGVSVGQAVETGADLFVIDPA